MLSPCPRSIPLCVAEISTVCQRSMELRQVLAVDSHSNNIHHTPEHSHHRLFSVWWWFCPPLPISVWNAINSSWTDLLLLSPVNQLNNTTVKLFLDDILILLQQLWVRPQTFQRRVETISCQQVIIWNSWVFIPEWERNFIVVSIKSHFPAIISREVVIFSLFFNSQCFIIPKSWEVRLA